MRSLFVLIATASVVALAGVGVASASTSVSWKATFPEQFGGPNHSPFTCPEGTSCGTGEVTHLGQAQDLVVFDACGPNCAVRTMTFADGSTIVMQEVEGDVHVPGNSGNPRSYGNPARIDLTETIVGGTGRFAGATGSAGGEVNTAGGTAIIKLSGTVTF